MNNYTTVALAYRSSSAAMTICSLEAAGFDVFCPGYNIVNMIPHWSLAIGGIQIAVPEHQASDARDLLHSFETTSRKRTPCISHVMNGAGYWMFGVSSPWPDLIVRD